MNRFSRFGDSAAWPVQRLVLGPGRPYGQRHRKARLSHWTTDRAG